MISWRSAVFNDDDLNIGVIGSSGVGKSTFINTIRRLTPTDPDAAPTGVVQTTMEPTTYAHPQNARVKLWDLPGCGTQNFSRAQCLEAIKSKNFEFFIIICCSRFTSDDLWFAKKVQEAEKRSYFVRTKTDIDLRNYRHDYPHVPRNRVLEKLKNDCTANLCTAGLQKFPVFLICKNPIGYDFIRLEEEIITDLPERWRQELLLTVYSVSSKINKDKAMLLVQKSSWLASENPAAITDVSHHQLPIPPDSESLSSEVMHYMKVFGLDDEGLKQFSKSTNVPQQILVDAINKEFWSNFSGDALLKELTNWNANGGADDGTQHATYAVEDYAKSQQIIKDRLRDVIQSMEISMNFVISRAYSHFEQSDWV